MRTSSRAPIAARRSASSTRASVEFALVTALDEGDGAKGALVIAAVGDAQIGPVFGGQRLPRRALHQLVGGAADLEQLVDMLDDLRFPVQSQDAVGFGKLAFELCLVALRQAAGDDDALAFATAASQFLGGHDGVDRFLFGGTDEAAGVDDDDVRVCFVVRDLVVIAAEQAEHALGVDEILRAPETDDVDFAICHRRQQVSWI